MTISILCMVPSQHLERLFPSHGFLGIFLVALVFLPSTSSDGCGAPPTFETMQLTGQPKNHYDVGEQVQYECKPGFQRKPASAPSATCAAAGTWSSLSSDACFKKSCAVQPDPDNGQVQLLNGSYEFGTQVKFVCNQGFYLIGKEILHCQLKGSKVSWSGDPPQCEKILCEPPPQIENGRYTPAGKEVFEYFEIVTYSCNPNKGPDQFSLIGQSQLHCSGRGQWSSDPPQCKVVKCPYPVVENGKQISGFGNKYYYNATAMFECVEGFYLHGSNIISCGSDSTWQPSLPKCLTWVPSSTKSPSSSRKPSSNEGSLDCKNFNEWILPLIIIILLELQ